MSSTASAEECDRGDDLRTDDGLVPHDGPLVDGERPLLAQDLLGDADLADVVEEEPIAEDGGLRELGLDRRASANPYAWVRSRCPRVVRSFASITWARLFIVAI